MIRLHTAGGAGICSRTHQLSDGMQTDTRSHHRQIPYTANLTVPAHKDTRHRHAPAQECWTVPAAGTPAPAGLLRLGLQARTS